MRIRNTDEPAAKRFLLDAARRENQPIPTVDRTCVPQFRGAADSGGRNNAGSTMAPLSDTPQ